MRKIVLIVFLSFLLFNKANPNNIECKNKFELTTIDNKKIVIYLNLNVASEMIEIWINPKNKIIISGYAGLTEEIETINKKFLKLSFKEKFGSGEKAARTIWICVNNNKLFKAFDVYSYRKSILNAVYDREADSLKLFDELYEYKLSFKNIVECKGRIYAYFDEEVHSKSINKNENNYTLRDSIILFFNDANNVFYSNSTIIDGSFIIVDNNLTTPMTFVKEKILVIELKNECYYFIKKKWYVKGKENYLIVC
ncbi:MAG: hypothetical protein V2A54_05895 [Bacteroidota bacterium]